MLSTVLIKFAKTVKDNFYSWCHKARQTFNEKMTQLPDDDQKTKNNLECKIKNLDNTQACLTKFLKSYDTTQYLTTVITHLKPLLETSVEWVQKLNRSECDKYEIPVLKGFIFNVETKA